MYALNIRKYFIILNILATLSQHLPLQCDKQIATIIVSATATMPEMQTKMASDAKTQLSIILTQNKVNSRDFVETPAAITAPRTTSASAFVDEVLPHNDSVATTQMLHAKAIDSSSSNSNMTYLYNNYNKSNNNSNNNTDDFQQLLEHKLHEEQKVAGVSAALTTVDGFTTLPLPPDQRLLSRKRRYLIFPEGSSFQLVYDGIFGIVDYTNYLILGITVALAWELPDKPQGEVIEEIANRLRGDSPEVRRRNDTATDDITYTTNMKEQQTPITIKHLQQAIINSPRPNYINLLTSTSPAARKSAIYTNAQRLSEAFHAPMHQKYYFYNGNNKYDYNSKNNNLLRRPTDTYYHRKVALPVGGYYKAQPSDWRRKDDYYYKPDRKNKNPYKNNFESSTWKVNPFSKWTAQQQHRYPASAYTTHKYTTQESGAYGQYPWWNLKSRLSNSLRRKPIPSRRIDNAKNQPTQQQHQQQPQQQQTQRHGKSAWQLQEQEGEAEAAAASGFYREPPATARKHRIYPVFGKRSIADEHPTMSTTATVAATQQHSINNNTSGSKTHSTPQQSMPHRRFRRSGIVGTELSRMERIHVRHHRSTRQALYEKIEKYLDKLNIKHSHQCILRALCETGQKSMERRPGTFVGEIMRAVFTIPEALEEDMLENRIHYKDQRYDSANTFEGNCAKEYALCEQSLWETHFVK